VLGVISPERKPSFSLSLSVAKTTVPGPTPDGRRHDVCFVLEERLSGFSVAPVPLPLVKVRFHTRLPSTECLRILFPKPLHAFSAYMRFFCLSFPLGPSCTILPLGRCRPAGVTPPPPSLLRRPGAFVSSHPFDESPRPTSFSSVVIHTSPPQSCHLSVFSFINCLADPRFLVQNSSSKAAGSPLFPISASSYLSRSGLEPMSLSSPLSPFSKTSDSIPYYPLPLAYSAHITASTSSFSESAKDPLFSPLLVQSCLPDRRQCFPSSSFRGCVGQIGI